MTKAGFCGKVILRPTGADPFARRRDTKCLSGQVSWSSRKDIPGISFASSKSPPNLQYTDPEAFRSACNERNPRFSSGEAIHRLDLSDDMIDWKEGLPGATLDLYDTFQMERQERVLKGSFDWVICPGGNRWSPYDRAAHAAQQIIDAIATSDHGIVIAGSTRPLNDKDKYAAMMYAAGAETEYDLCLGAANKIQERYPNLTITTVCEDNPRSGNDGVIDRVMEEIGGGAGLSFGIVTTMYYYVGMCLDAARARKRHQWDSVRVAGHTTTPWMLLERTDLMKYCECLVTLYKASQAYEAGC